MSKVHSVDPKHLLRQLLEADSEDDVKAILESAGYWSNTNAWRHYGDKEGNFGHIGAQQSQPDAALVEKLTNSIDALLLGELRARGIDPEGPKAPKTMAEAVALAFGAKSGLGAGNGMSDWIFDKSRLGELAKRLQIAVTGSKQRPCVTIYDAGEGQRPSMIPETFVSLDRQNKARIPFVQGKFNMGGSGVLRFCGTMGLELIVSRRDPRIVAATKDASVDADCWGFTVVRREETSGRSSTYTYLAPVGADEKRRGGVLHFKAESLNLVPAKKDPYATPVSYGSLIKLYEYDLKGFSSNAIFPDQLRGRLEVKLPEPALPVRITECRAYGGHSGSNSTFISGVVHRLTEDREKNLEPGFPSSVQLIVDGERVSARIYAFKNKEARESYFHSADGIVFVVNGQTHGSVKQSFYTQKRVNMSRLAGSIVTVVDCTTLSQLARENIFMTSRDRLSENAISKRLVDELADVIKNHSGLRELAARRKEEEIQNQLKDDKPLEEILEKLLRTSPTLERLLPKGMRLPAIGQLGGGAGNGTGGRGTEPFVGKKHPTFFRFKGKPNDHILIRNFEIGHRCRIGFETDVVNDYFEREELRGFYDVTAVDDSGIATSASISLHDGVATVSLDFGSKIKAGDTFALAITVKDDTLVNEFVNVVHLTALEERDHPPGGETRRNGAKGKGDKNDGPGALALPKIKRIQRDQWEEVGFDQYTAADVLEEDGGVEVKINVDNLSLHAALKSTKEDARIVETRFIFGNVLLSLGVLQRFEELEKLKAADKGDADDPIRALLEIGAPTLIKELTRATAPFLLTMIDSLSDFGEDDVLALAAASDLE